jgi:hypothetical protein
MADLNIACVDQNGDPVGGELVTLNTFSADDWAQPGVEINPNPRRTGDNGVINFYSGPPLAKPIMVQATAQNGTSTPMRFDATDDLTVTVVRIPFD